MINKNMRDKDSLLLENIYSTISNVDTNTLMLEELEMCEECRSFLTEAKSVLSPEEKVFETEIKKKLPKLSLLSVMADAKTIKSIRDTRSVGDRFLTGILYIAPSKEGGVDVCVGSSGCCRIGCLNTAGNPATLQTKILSRIRKAQELHLTPELFYTKLKSDILVLDSVAKVLGLKTAIRLNGTSDYDFGQDLEEFITQQTAKGIKFYDYTKILPRYKKYSQSGLIHQTFSRSERNDKQALEVLKNGGNVAYVFYNKSNTLPEYYLGFRVVNGDESDLRFLDDALKQHKGEGLIIGLSAKGSVKGKGARSRAIRRSIMWNKKQQDPNYIDSPEFKKDAADYFGVNQLDELLGDKDKMDEFQDFRKGGRLLEPDGGFEIIVDDLKKIKPEVFDKNYKA
jgi:hypothetical protein